MQLECHIVFPASSHGLFRLSNYTYINCSYVWWRNPQRAGAACHSNNVPERDLRPDVRVLAVQRGGPAHFQRDEHVPHAEESRWI